MSISSTASSATCLLVATTLTTGCPSYVAVCWASAKCGMGGACGTGRKMPIGSVRIAMSLPNRISRTPSSPSAAATSMRRMRACGYGQRPIAISTLCAGSTSSVNRPAPQRSRASSLRGASAPRPRRAWRADGCSSRTSTSVITHRVRRAAQVALDCGDDGLVAGAAAQYPGDFGPDLVPGQLAASARESRCRHEEAGCAEAALQRMLAGEEFLQRAERVAVRECLDRLHAAAVELRREHQARLDS